MMKLFTILFLLASPLFITSVLAQERWVLFSPKQALSLLKTCTRYTPKADGIWIVHTKAITQLEQDLPKLSNLTSVLSFDGEEPSYKLRVNNPIAYFRQYGGITIRGKKFIYVNAFDSIDNWPEWKNRTVNMCHGDNSYWGVLYNPSTRKFSQLAFNYSR